MKHPERRSEVGQRFQRALRNKRVQMALATLLVGLIVNLLPNLQGVESEILAVISALLLALFGDYTVRDAARLGHEHGQNGANDEVWAESD